MKNSDESLQLVGLLCVNAGLFQVDLYKFVFAEENIVEGHLGLQGSCLFGGWLLAYTFFGEPTSILLSC